MNGKNTKVVIVGAGNVGAAAAFSIVQQGLCDEVVLIDQNKEKAEGEALDLRHSIFFMSRNVRVRAGNYRDCEDADIAVITASAPMDPNSDDRLKMLEMSERIMESIVGSIMENHFSGILLVVSNPVDIMTYYAWKLSGLPKNQVIGSGTALDTARMAGSVAELFEVDARSVDIYVIGEHGDSETVCWNSAAVGGKNLIDVMQDNSQRTGAMTPEELRKATVQAGWEVFHRKGNTSFGIAASVTSIVKAILFDENRIYPVTVYLEGEYGLRDVYISVPTIINRTGAKEIVEIKLTEEEQRNLEVSVNIVKSYYKGL
ncbi:MAG: L-lactate dehydrogenase [Eubacteriales bacterium]|nr:L-lactate dehydrogenase [Eubacteriales bacterium]